MEQTSVELCPSCDSANSQPLLETNDWFLSQEPFQIVKCTNCSLGFTTPVPSNLSPYYQSTEYISHSEKGGIIPKVYKTVQQYTLRQKLRLIQKHNVGNSIIDYGAGKGDFLAHMKKAGYEVQGYEPDNGVRKLAKAKNNLTLHSNLENLNDDVDVVTMWHVLEHVPNPNEIIELLKSKLKKTGVLIIAVPNMASFDANYYHKYWAAYDVPRHLLHFTPESMSALLKRHQLRITEIQGMWFDSFYVSLLSEKYSNKLDSTILGLPKAIAVGLRSNLKAIINIQRCSSLIYVIKPQ